MARRRKGSVKGSVRKLLINAKEPEESRIAILHGGKLDEYYIERQSLGSTLGNIYKARITNVEKSIGAAFVDFGHTRQGFLHVSDLSMEAVGEDARELLAGVQAAREVAHDEDVVEPRRRERAPTEGEVGEDGGFPAADGAATEDVSEEAGPGEVAEVEPSPLDEAEEEGDEEVLAAPPELAADDLVESWAAGGRERDLERGAGVAELAESEDEDDDDDEQDEGLPPAPEVIDLEEEEDDDDDEEDQEEEGDDEDDEEDDAEEDEDDEDASEPRAGEAGRERFGVDGDEQGASEVAAQAVEGEAPQNGTGRARRGRRRGGRRRRRGGQAGEAARTETVEPGEAAGEESPSETQDADEDGEERGGDGRRRRGRRGGRRRRNAAPRREPRLMPPIEDVLGKGQEIVVQVIKEGIGTKGPTLTTFLSIPGRFVVLMPGMRKRGVSRKVTNTPERERLKNIVRDLQCPDELGFIVRTAGSGCSKDDLQRDLDYLLRLWQQMKTRIREHRAPVLLYQENDLVIRTLRDLYDGQGEIVIDDAPTASRAREFLGQILPECVDKVQAYEGEKPLFSHYGIETELQRLLQSRLELKSGASLIIEQTEALVAIDVNSGRFRPESHKDIDETAFQVNCEAAVEVARQLRLRDLGGVVVIDFIDMRQERHRKQLERLFKDELRKDRARLKVARFSPFGILELTRQRVRPSLKRTVHQRCPYCEGTGFIPSDETSCLAVVRKVRENLWRPGSVLYVTVRPEVAEAVLNTQRQTLAELEQRSGKSVFVRADHRLAYDEIEVKAMITLPGEVDHRRA